jgi:hypothetical protein
MLNLQTQKERQYQYTHRLAAGEMSRDDLGFFIDTITASLHLPVYCTLHSKRLHGIHHRSSSTLAPTPVLSFVGQPSVRSAEHIVC